MKTNDGSRDYTKLPKPSIDRVEGTLKERLEALLKTHICPLAVKETYEEAGPWGIDLIFYDCQDGGDVELENGIAGQRPCSSEYAQSCQTYKAYQRPINPVSGNN